MRALARCVFCADVIGVYEPAIALGDERARRTSIAREPDLGHGPEVIAHAACATHLREVQDIADRVRAD